MEMMLSIRKLKQQVQIGFFAPFFDVLQRNKIDIDKKQLMKNYFFLTSSVFKDLSEQSFSETRENCFVLYWEKKYKFVKNGT